MLFKKPYLLILLMIVLGCQPSSAKHEDSTLMWGFALEGYPMEKSLLLELQNQTTLVPQLISFYVQWPLPGKQQILPASSLEAIWKIGAIPCLSWEPMYYHDNQRQAILYEDLLHHKYDDYLEKFSTSIKIWGRPVVIRLAHEMNLNEYHWGTDPSQYGPKSPEIYVQIFRYLVTYFKQKGISNVLWAFCPNADSVPSEKEAGTEWNRISQYYPGTEFVDILGMDGYDWGVTKNSPNGTSFEQVFKRLYHELKSLAPQKPIIVFETATAATGQERRIWIDDALKTAKAWRLDGIIWFQVNKEHAWQLTPDDDVSNIREASSFSQNWLNGLLQTETK